MKLKSFIRDFIGMFKVKHEEAYAKSVKLQVVESNKVKMFKLDDVTHSTINKRSIYTGGFWDYFIPLAYLYKNPSVLMIGLGMGTTVYQFRSLFGNKVKLDIVEKVPQVAELVKKHVDYLKHEKITIGDGASYVSGKKARYDLVILDAYEKAAHIPDQFFTERFVINASRALKKDGILAINYAMNPSGMARFAGLKALLKSSFNVYSVNTDSYGGMRILVCSKKFGKEEILDKISSSMKKTKATSMILERYSRMKRI